MTTDDGAPDPPQPSGWQRVLQGLTRRPSRGQLIVAVLLCLLGVAAATQIRLTRAGNDFSGQRRDDLVTLLDSLSSANDRARTQLEDLEKTKTQLQSSSRQRAAVVQEAQSRLTVLGILTGTLPATGPGITITIADPAGSVTAASILDGVEELRDAGAEAIEINDEVRIVASSSFTSGNGEIKIDHTTVRPPYVIDAIGGSHTLSEAVVFPGGLTDTLQREGASVSVHEVNVVQVGSLHTIKQPQYAQPTSR